MHSRAKSRIVITIGLVAVLALAAWTSTSGASGTPRGLPEAHPAGQCSSSDTGPTNPANPLDTPGFTGTDPLSGAHLFVESPWQYGGDAADAIANEVGLGYLSTEESGTPIPWARFEARVDEMHLSRASPTESTSSRRSATTRRRTSSACTPPAAQDRRSSPRFRTTCAGCNGPIPARRRK